MKAILLHPGTQQVRLADVENPVKKNPDDVQVKVLHVGICGTDREEAAGGRAEAPPGKQELIIGHEMLGQVIDVGPEVKNLKPSDYVVTTVRRSCGICPACKVGRFDMCTTGKYTERGIKGRDGFQSEVIVDQEQYMIQVPSDIVSIAVLTEPMSVVEKAIDEAWLIQKARIPYGNKNESIDEKNRITAQGAWLKGKNTIVAGLGPVGLLAALILRLRGANVFGLDVVEDTNLRVQILKDMGGQYINSRSIDPKNLPNIDLIVEAAGVAVLDFDLLEALGINGTYVLTGIPGKQRLLNIDGAELMRKLVLKNQVMVGSVNASYNHFHLGVQDLKTANDLWPQAVAKMITQRLPYTAFQEALFHKTNDEIKVVFEWNQKL